LKALIIAREDPFQFLARHKSGDWGDCCPEDARENDLSVKQGFRILSVYSTCKGEKLWVITEADRSVTTLLLPSEY
jgi:hypothetical protein